MNTIEVHIEMNTIEVHIDAAANSVRAWNSGRGIPVVSQDASDYCALAHIRPLAHGQQLRTRIPSDTIALDWRDRPRVLLDEAGELDEAVKLYSIIR